jgi:hypothetical protein
MDIVILGEAENDGGFRQLLECLAQERCKRSHIQADVLVHLEIHLVIGFTLETGAIPISSIRLRMAGIEIFPPLLTSRPFISTRGNCAPAGRVGQAASNKSKYSTRTESPNRVVSFRAAHCAISRQESFTPSAQATGAPMI